MHHKVMKLVSIINVSSNLLKLLVMHDWLCQIVGLLSYRVQVEKGVMVILRIARLRLLWLLNILLLVPL